jgi:hypothetical protein
VSSLDFCNFIHLIFLHGFRVVLSPLLHLNVLKKDLSR